MNNKVIKDVCLYVTRSLTKDQREIEKRKKKIELRNQSRKLTLHVKSNSSEPFSETLLRDELKIYGDIHSVTIKSQEIEQGKPIVGMIAFVQFANEEAATRVLLFNLYIGCK